MRRIRLLNSAAELIGSFDVAADEPPLIVEKDGHLFALQIAGSGLPNDQPAVRTYQEAEPFPVLVESVDAEKAEGDAPSAGAAAADTSEADAAAGRKVRERATQWLDDKIAHAPSRSADDLADDARAVRDMIQETGFTDLAPKWQAAFAERTAALKAEADKAGALGELLDAEIEKAKTATGDQLVELDAGVRKLLADEARDDLLPKWEAAFDARKAELAAG